MAACSKSTPSLTASHAALSVLGLSVANVITIPLERGQWNAVAIPVTVTSTGAWRLSISDPNAGPNTGHMTGAEAALVDGLAASVDGGPEVRLDQRGPVVISSGVGNAVVRIELRQVVSPFDPPGGYTIRLVFQAISGF